MLFLSAFAERQRRFHVCELPWSLLTDVVEVKGPAGAPLLGDCMMIGEGVSVSVCVCVLDWGWPLSARCVTSAAALSPANGALVEPRKESPAEALLLLLMLDQHQRKSGRMTTVGPPSTRWLCFAVGVTERSSI